MPLNEEGKGFDRKGAYHVARLNINNGNSKRRGKTTVDSNNEPAAKKKKKKKSASPRHTPVQASMLRELERGRFDLRMRSAEFLRREACVHDRMYVKHSF